MKIYFRNPDHVQLLLHLAESVHQGDHQLPGTVCLSSQLVFVSKQITPASEIGWPSNKYINKPGVHFPDRSWLQQLERSLVASKPHFPARDVTVNKAIAHTGIAVLHIAVTWLLVRKRLVMMILTVIITMMRLRNMLMSKRWMMWSVESISDQPRSESGKV